MCYSGSYMDTTKTNNEPETEIDPRLQLKAVQALIKHQTTERLSRIDREFADGFEIINRYTDTVCVFGSARFTEDHPYYQQARNVSDAISKEGYTIVTGGGGGIMEAGNRGAFESGGKSLGFNIKLPHEQVLNPYTTESMPFNYFFARKVILAYGAGAYLFFPGGFGTLDELFEVLTLIQTGKMPKAPVVLVGVDFWTDLDEFIKKHMVDHAKTITPGDEQLYTVTDDVAEIISRINTYNQPVQELTRDTLANV